MSKTTAELRESVAKEIGILTPAMPLADDDADLIDARIQEVSDYLRELGLAWWVDNSIPNAAMMPMTLMVAARVCGNFGKATPLLLSGFEGGKAQLAAIKPSAVIQTVQAQYY